MGQPPPPLDIVTVLVAVAGAVFAPRVAEIVGPYAAILLGSLLGASWSAARRPPAPRYGRLRTAGYILGLMLLAVLITVLVAEVAARWLGLESRLLFAPIAVLIGGIGDEWPTVGRWLVRSIAARFERPPAGPGGPQP